MRQPEAIVTMLLLSDGDKARKNRRFLLNPDVAFAASASTEVVSSAERFSGAGDRLHGPIGVVSLLSKYFPSLEGERTVEFQGPVQARRRPMPREMRAILDSCPSEEACDLVLTALQQGKKVKLEYTDGSLVITVSTKDGKPETTRLRWK